MASADRQILIMGILNLNEDSYYAPSRYNMSVLDSTADIIDIGAVSTRPGAAEVSEKEEWSRLSPVLGSISTDRTVSIDTTRASIVERCCDALGRPVMVNDISSGEDDPQMLDTVARLGLQYVAMHKRGTPATMQSLCGYDDVVAEVKDYFKDFSAKADSAGVKDWILDPGFGFAKTAQQNFELLDGLESFKGFGQKLLVGISRKSFIYKTLGLGPEDVLHATQAMHLAALERGADILRVHDVEAAAHTVALYRKLKGC